jgi:twitching motility protein PilT
MVATQTIREAIIDPDKTRKIHDIIAQGASQYGMQTFDQSLYDLFKRQLVTYEEAIKWTTNPEDFALKVKGIQSTGESWDDAQGKEDGGEKLQVDRF